MQNHQHGYKNKHSSSISSIVTTIIDTTTTMHSASQIKNPRGQNSLTHSYPCFLSVWRGFCRLAREAPR